MVRRNITRCFLDINTEMCKFTHTYGSLVLILILGCTWQSCHGSGTYGFNIYHRLSDPVKAMFTTTNEFPEKGTVDYYAGMVHRDRFFHGRRLAGERADETALSFVAGNTTLLIPALGYLYYANVSVGTPETWYLVALDTGSGLFWLPCECAPNCIQSFQLSPTEAITFNTYSLGRSSTGTQLSCTSPVCQNRISCSPSELHCSYRVDYQSENTSSSGYMVQDVLHLTKNGDSSTLNDVKIAFGCGVVQTGSFLRTAAPNGLLGLTMDAISLPSTLASQNLAANSFSMCFNGHGTGRINFGDKGSKEQGETPLNLDGSNLYSVSITHVTVGTNVSAANFTAIIDSGTSFTLLTDPLYSLLSEKLDSQVKDRRVEVDPRIPFQFCYETNSRPRDWIIPATNLTMRGGDVFSVTHPWIAVLIEDGSYIYCLSVVKSEHDHMNINIIGENFLTGYRIIFDNEKKVLGWKASDCDEAVFFSPSPFEYITPGSDAAASLQRSWLTVGILLVQIFSIHLYSSN